MPRAGGETMSKTRLVAELGDSGGDRHLTVYDLNDLHGQAEIRADSRVEATAALRLLGWRPVRWHIAHGMWESNLRRLP